MLSSRVLAYSRCAGFPLYVSIPDSSRPSNFHNLRGQNNLPTQLRLRRKMSEMKKVYTDKAAPRTYSTKIPIRQLRLELPKLAQG